MKEELFREYFTGENASGYTITCSYYSLFDYTQIDASEVEHLVKETNICLMRVRFEAL